jgi:arabinofuranosyltransferase
MFQKAVPRRIAAIFVICAVTAFLTFTGRHFQLDDALIYARYTRNALHGMGLVFNAGEHVNALTSPLFSVLLLATSWLLHGNVLLAEMLLSAVFLAASCILAEELAPWSGALIASTYYFYLCFGMETTLFLFLIMLSFFLYREDKLDLVPTVALLTALTRFEGGLLAVVIAADMWRTRQFPRMRALLLPALILVGYLGFNLHFYGSLLPSSASAKFGQGFSGYWGKWPRAFTHVRPILAFFHDSIYVLPVAFILGIFGVRSRQGTPMNRILLPFLGGLLAFYLLLNIPNYHWYDAPFLFFLLIYAVAGVPNTRLAHILLAAVIVQCAAAAAWNLHHSGPRADYVAAAEWISSHSAPGAKIAAVETGTIGWNTDRYVDDILGLTNPKNALLLQHRDLFTWLEEDKPDFVIVHHPAAFGENAATASSHYVYEPIHFGSVYLMRRKDTTKAPGLERTYLRAHRFRLHAPAENVVVSTACKTTIATTAQRKMRPWRVSSASAKTPPINAIKNGTAHSHG